MAVHTEYLWFQTPQKRMLVNITPELDRIAKKCGVKEGLMLVSSMHITSGIWVSDNEDGLHEDLDKWLDQLAPVDPDYKHHKTGEDNADAHLKRTIIGHQVTLPITDGKIDLGPWETVFYAEFDGMRKKRVIIKIVGE
jgi:secondary thiamine-phosphate synthase enzyme